MLNYAKSLKSLCSSFHFYFCGQNRMINDFPPLFKKFLEKKWRLRKLQLSKCKSFFRKPDSTLRFCLLHFALREKGSSEDEDEVLQRKMCIFTSSLLAPKWMRELTFLVVVEVVKGGTRKFCRLTG